MFEYLALGSGPDSGVQAAIRAGYDETERDARFTSAILLETKRIANAIKQEVGARFTAAYVAALEVMTDPAVTAKRMRNILADPQVMAQYDRMLLEAYTARTKVDVSLSSEQTIEILDRMRSPDNVSATLTRAAATLERRAVPPKATAPADISPPHQERKTPPTDPAGLMLAPSISSLRQRRPPQADIPPPAHSESRENELAVHGLRRRPIVDFFVLYYQSCRVFCRLTRHFQHAAGVRCQRHNARQLNVRTDVTWQLVEISAGALMWEAMN